MPTIKDSVHDHIEVTGVATELLDTPAMQRLRRISQLGTVSLVYPAANHTRLEHSIGVYALARRACEVLSIEGTARDELVAAALLHDVGHPPFSHNIEGLIQQETGKLHDDVLDIVSAGRVGETLRAYGLSPTRIADLIRGDGRYGQVISGDLDVDRMDYLLRDAHHTGVAYGTIDHERLVRALRFVDETLVFAAGNLQTAESLLLARALMNPTVYQHHVARIARRMLWAASEQLLASTPIDASTLRRMDDVDLRARLRGESSTAPMVARIDERRLFKRAIWAEWTAVPAPVRAASDADQAALRTAIAEHAEVAVEEVLLDIPSGPSMPEASTQIAVGDAIVSIAAASPLVQALQQTNEANWRLGVYTPATHREAVQLAAIEVLGLDTAQSILADRADSAIARLDQF
jgi:HD superfamily phosphohydrolase